MKLQLLLGVVILFDAQVSGADVYKWVDPEGKVHYSDKPVSVKSEKLQLEKVESPDASPKTTHDDALTNPRKIIGDNAAYCEGLLRDVEYNKRGGEMIVVDKDVKTGKITYREATQDVRDKNLKILQSDFDKACKAH